MEHPDEERARAILEAKLVETERRIEDGPLWTMIDSLAVTFNQMQDEIERRGD